MTFCVRFEDTVQLKGSPGGARILAALDWAANRIGHDITVTSGADGEHSGPEDPHHRGDAYDSRIHDLQDHQACLTAIQDFLGPRFYAFIEDEGTPNAHIHSQVAKGTVYP